MDEIEVAREARLLAIETMLVHLYNVVNRLAGADEYVIAEIERQAMETLRVTPVRQVAPEWSDHLSAEAAQAFAAILERARESRGQPG